MSRKIFTILRRYAFIIIIVALFFIVRAFLQTAVVSGTSMENTLIEDDLLIIHKTETVDYSDIAVIWFAEKNEYLCKRIIGKAGDTISVDLINKQLLRNNKPIDEPYVKDGYQGLETINTVTVPEGYVYVLGDNRLVSYDSRKFGCQPIHNILGVSLIDLTKSYGVDKSIRIKLIIGLIIVYLVLVLLDSISKRKHITGENNYNNQENTEENHNE